MVMVFALSSRWTFKISWSAVHPMPLVHMPARIRPLLKSKGLRIIGRRHKSEFSARSYKRICSSALRMTKTRPAASFADSKQIPFMTFTASSKSKGKGVGVSVGVAVGCAGVGEGSGLTGSDSVGVSV